jgi:hypothetical protein
MKRCLSVVIVAMVGCASVPEKKRYALNIDSISNSNNHARKYFVMTDVVDSQLQKNEYIKYVENALTKVGFSTSPDMIQAEAVLVFSYGIKGQTRIGSSPEYDWVSPKSYDFNTMNSNGRRSSGTVSETGLGHLERTGTNYYTYAVFTRAIILTAYDGDSVKKYSKDKKSLPQEIWKTTILSTGPSQDMRKIFPYMLYGAVEYLGKDTAGQIKTEIEENDARVEQIKQQKNNPLHPLQIPISRP